jgi:RNA-directed DNA polymerase
MMHGHEKSDPAIVAMKPANKAVLAAAESVERRAGAEGNARQQSTRRTQTRARVTQALDRVRQAARLRKKERFTALLHHVSVDTLQTAFHALKRKAAPGVDGMTWREYETGLELRLEALHGRIHRGAYRPQPARRTYIPKATGAATGGRRPGGQNRSECCRHGAERHLRGRIPRTRYPRCAGRPGGCDRHAKGEP